MRRISIRDMRQCISKKLAALSGRFFAVSRNGRACVRASPCAPNLNSTCCGDAFAWRQDPSVRQMIVQLGIGEPAEIAFDLVELEVFPVENVSVLAKFSEHVRGSHDDEVLERPAEHDSLDRLHDVAGELLVARVRVLLAVIVGRLLMRAVTRPVHPAFAGARLREHRADVPASGVHQILDLVQLVAGRVAFVVLADASSRGVDDRDAGSHDERRCKAGTIQNADENTGNTIAAVDVGSVNVF